VSASAVSIRDVSKRFRRHLDRRESLKEMVARGRSKKLQDFWALRDVTLDISRGSVHGLMGHNGSGKSTLLKIVSGIYRPTEGAVSVHGRLAALIELGAGFHPDMTGRENIRLNGSIMGLSRQEVADSMDTIIDFSGLREFIDDPVKHYSSGMTVRLGFSVAVHLDPEVLLVDEVLAVGDEEFQRKCFDHLSYLRKRGTTIIVVSHALGQLESLCDEVTRIEMCDTSGRVLDHAESGATTCFRIGLRTPERFLGPNVRLAIQHESGALVGMIGNHRHGFDIGWLQGDHVFTVALRDTPLLPGRYIVHLDVFDHTGARLVDTWTDALEFVVRSQRGEMGQGLVDLPADFRIE
jgi:ABC-type polysaccharide/polyol phosphate transport system ATPase subunit